MAASVPYPQAAADGGYLNGIPSCLHRGRREHGWGRPDRRGCRDANSQMPGRSSAHTLHVLLFPISLSRVSISHSRVSILWGEKVSRS